MRDSCREKESNEGTNGGRASKIEVRGELEARKGRRKIVGKGRVICKKSRRIMKEKVEAGRRKEK